MTFIYDPPYADEKEEFWSSLSSLRGNRTENWHLIGDSNIVAKPEVKIRGLPFDSLHANWFYDFMDYSYMLELPIKGWTFTFSYLRSEDEAILEKLDRVIISLEWSIDFPKAIGVLHVALASDHAPIFLLLKGLNKKYKKEFKFEAKGLLKEDCSVNVRESWRPVNINSRNLVFDKKLSRTISRLKQWSKLKYEKNIKMEDELKGKIKTL
ncbi:hypothetical protein V6N11_034757 [Hibiscus sabdariffa]|uniref:Uncharacterized protein n=2 Tax=Hibiscus sabdariffa TaxID=183260 RepID=A0ABR2NRS2_9ROSI